MSQHDRQQRIARLNQAAASRSSETAARAQRAITRLVNSGQPVTFIAVARTGDVSTSFLYQHTEFRAAITRHRSTATNTTNVSRSASQASVESLRQKLVAATARNRELTEQLEQLREETKALRSQLLEPQPPR